MCSSVTETQKCYVKLWYMWKNILQYILVKLDCLKYSKIDMNYLCAIQRSYLRNITYLYLKNIYFPPNFSS